MAPAWSSRASCDPTPCRAHRPPWPTSWDCATWPSRSTTCRRLSIGQLPRATDWSVASASTRARGGWPTSGGRKGSSSHWPSASAEPRNARICRRERDFARLLVGCTGRRGGTAAAVFPDGLDGQHYSQHEQGIFSVADFDGELLPERPQLRYRNHRRTTASDGVLPAGEVSACLQNAGRRVDLKALAEESARTHSGQLAARENFVAHRPSPANADRDFCSRTIAEGQFPGEREPAVNVELRHPRVVCNCEPVAERPLARN